MARFALSAILYFLAANAVAAQDALPETPPELRDFRLDPERAQPTPQPQPEVQPPPVTRTVKPEPQPAERRPVRAAPTQPRQVERPTPPASDDQAAPIEPQSEQTAEPVPAVVERPPETAEPVTEAAPAPIPNSSLPWWQIMAAMAAAIMALLAGWLFWRSRPAAAQPVNVQTVEMVEPAPAPLAVARTSPIAVAERAEPRPRISLEFIPGKATLGINMLTLKGQLQLVNEGDSPASDMQFRAILTSANQRQNDTIAAFHNGAITIAPNALGSAKEGERLSLDIEMSVPVSELESYTVNGKRIFVPLMLARLEYGWADGKDKATLACMIGRETEPPQPKMGPLRLDLGPRSFAPLGQRPVYA